MAELPPYTIPIPPPSNTSWKLETIRTRVECRGAPPVNAVGGVPGGPENNPGTDCRSVYDPSGPNLLLHWADLELADAWSEWLGQLDEGLSAGYAAKIRSAPEYVSGSQARRDYFERLIANYEMVCGQSPADALRKGTVRVLLSRMFGSIANYYNSINIPWPSDPLARDLYRKWLAGPPAAADPEHPQSSHEFAEGVDYNDQWYTGDSAAGSPNYPLINQNNSTPVCQTDYIRQPDGTYQWARRSGQAPCSPLGIIPMSLVVAFRDRNPEAARTHALEFRQTAGLQLVLSPVGRNVTGYPTSSHAANNDPVFARYIMNWSFVDEVPSNEATGSYASAGVQIETAQKAAWWSIPFATNFQCFPDHALRTAAGLNPTECDGGHFMTDFNRAGGGNNQRIWSSYAWAVPGIDPGTGLAAAAPLALYIGWAKEWIRAIRQRSARQVIVDSRKYAVFVNTILANKYGSATNLFETTTTTLQMALEQKGHLDNNITVIAGAITAVGAALSSATYGISALIGAIIGAGLMVYNSMIEHGTTGLYKDDLGQWKPAFLRGWLDGTIIGINSSDNVPPSSVPVALPPVFTRAATGVSTLAELDPIAALRKMGIGCPAWTALGNTIPTDLPASNTRDPRIFNPRNLRILSASALQVRGPDGRLVAMSVDDADRLRLAINAYCANPTAPVRPAQPAFVLRPQSNVPVTTGSGPALEHLGQNLPPTFLAALQGLTPEQITQVVGANGELCAEWGTLTPEAKRSRLSTAGYGGDPVAAIALLDNRCGVISSEAAAIVTTPTAPKSKLPWVIGGAAVVAVGGTALYFALRKPRGGLDAPGA